MQIMNVATWSDYKTLVADKSLLLQYSETSTTYDIYAPEAQTFLWNICLLKGTSDATDFENNYQAAANAPMTIGGGTIQAHIIGETQIFTNEAIRDTAAHNSSTGQNSGFRVKTIIVQNTLNQDVSIQCQGSRDGSTWFNVGTTWPVTASTTTYQTCETYFPYLRAVATCAVAPTTGNLNLWLERMGS
jgi:hypothetical protein